MDRYTVISTDCHAGASYSKGGFLDYVEERHHDALRDEMARLTSEQAERMERLFASEFRSEQDGTDEAIQGGRSGAWDPDRRLQQLEADGIVAEVLFPDGSQNNAAPFDAAAGPGAVGADHALQTVGAWAYNRWLAEFCGHAAERRAVRFVIFGMGALPFGCRPSASPTLPISEGSTGEAWGSKLKKPRSSTVTHR